MNLKVNMQNELKMKLTSGKYDKNENQSLRTKMWHVKISEHKKTTLLISALVSVQL